MGPLDERVVVPSPINYLLLEKNIRPLEKGAVIPSSFDPIPQKQNR